MRVKGLRMAAACAALLFCLSGCGKSEQAQQVDDLIAAIGEVTLDSKAAIEQAEAGMESLSESDRKALENMLVYENALAEYQELVVQSVESQIAEIGTVTFESESAIQTARDAYEDCPEELRSQVSNYNVLEDAEKTLDNMRVQNVIDLIDAIGEVTLESEEKITIAKTAYNILPKTLQKEISNADVLWAAASALQEAKDAKERAEYYAALGRMKTEHDEVENITWYKPNAYPQYINSRCFVLPYIGQRDGYTWMRITFDYTNSDWLFMDSAIVSVDGTNYRYSFDYFDINRDVGYGDIAEVADISGEGEINMLQAIVDSEKTIIRFQGDDYYYDFTVKDSDKAAIRDVLTIYNYLNS